MIKFLLSLSLISVSSFAANSPDSKTVKPGEPVVLVCPGRYSDIQWVNPDGKPVVEDDRHILDEISGNLNITKVGEHDIGVYKCHEKSSNATVHQYTIQTSPYVLKMTKSYNHIVGETAKILCTAWGFQLPTMKWFVRKDSSGELEPIADDQVQYSIKDIKTSLRYHVSQELQIANLTEEDYAYYYCNATNDAGFSSSHTVLRVKGKLAPLWPFIGICVEIVVLIVIIAIYEKKKIKTIDDDDLKDDLNALSNTNDHKEEEHVRFRK